jgi:hypothetical protein
LAGGVYLAVGGSWPLAGLCLTGAAAVLWLGSWWALPLGGEAYASRLTGVITDWRTDVEAATDRMAHRQAKIVQQLERLTPPQELGDDDVLLLRALGAGSTNADSHRAAAAGEIEGLIVIDDLKKRLLATGSGHKGTVYGSTALSLAEEWQAAVSTATREAERAGERTLRRPSPDPCARSTHRGPCGADRCVGGSHHLGARSLRCSGAARCQRRDDGGTKVRCRHRMA